MDYGRHNNTFLTRLGYLFWYFSFLLRLINTVKYVNMSVTMTRLRTNIQLILDILGLEFMFVTQKLLRVIISILTLRKYFT